MESCLQKSTGMIKKQFGFPQHTTKNCEFGSKKG